MHVQDQAIIVVFFQRLIIWCGSCSLSWC